MPVEVKLPRLGQGMDEGKVLAWLKAEGETIGKGEELYEVETEKVNVEVESPAKGTLLKIVTHPGDTVPIGTVIAWIGEPGEAIPDTPAAPAASSNGAAAPVAAQAPAAAQAAPAPAPAAPVAVAAPAAAVAPTTSTAGDRIKASPLARRIAAEKHIDLTALAGTGPDGRIIARDLDGVAATPAAATAGAAPARAVEVGEGGTRVELTSMRKTIARRLSEAWQAPAFYLTISIDMTEANALRKKLVAATPEGAVRPTVSDILTKASAIALRRNPDVNVHFAGDAIIRYEPVHVGMAVATDNGLVVPVFRNAHASTIRELAAQRKVLVDKARAGKLTMDDMSGGTFSISNLGMMGIDQFQAVLNPPEAAILAIGQTVDTPVVRKGKVEVRPIMQVTATFDHRAVDGAVGARFLADLKTNLEDPTVML